MNNKHEMTRKRETIVICVICLTFSEAFPPTISDVLRLMTALVDSRRTNPNKNPSRGGISVKDLKIIEFFVRNTLKHKG
jgi:uncharacterized damage-inducible protein DinB